MTINSAIVNGCLGTIGLALVKRLIENGVKKVYAVAYPGDKRIERISEDAMVVQCDMRNIADLENLIQGPVDAFFHLAWMGAIGEGRNDMHLQTQNIQCALDAVDVAKKLECKVFVGVGSQAEYGKVEGKITADLPCYPITGYGMAKLCAGQMTRTACKQVGIRHVWARVLSVFGAYDGPLSVVSIILDQLFRREKPSLTAGEQMWDYIYADDAADALVCMAKDGRDGKIYPLGSGQSRMLREYFEILRDKVDPSLPLGFGEIPYQPNQVMHLEADISGLTADTGFVPTTSFEEAASKVIQLRRELYNMKN